MPCKVSIVKAGIHCIYLFIYLLNCPEFYEMIPNNSLLDNFSQKKKYVL